MRSAQDIDINITNKGQPVEVEIQTGRPGADGTPGADGSVIYTAQGVPVQGLGNNSDLYINLLNYDLYQKANDVWNLIGNIKGSPGEAGTGVVTVVANYSSLPVGEDGSLAYVINASDAPEQSITGKNVWAVYIYETQWNLVASQDDVTYNSAESDGTLTTAEWGAIPIGTDVATLRNSSMTQLVDTALFPVVEASVSQNKSATLNSSESGTVEVGTILDPTLTSTFSQGQIQNGNGSSGPALVGPPTSHVFTGPGITGDVTITSTNLVEAITTAEANFAPVAATFGTNQWNVVVNHSIGTGQYFDSKGVPASNLDGQRVAGSANDNSNSVTGRYRYFWDVDVAFPVDSAGVRAAANNGLLNGQNEGTFDISIPIGVTLVWFSIPAGKTITVNFVESFNLDVTGDFSNNAFNVNDAGGTPVAYDNYSTTIPGIGYTEVATYRVTIT